MKTKDAVARLAIVLFLVRVKADVLLELAAKNAAAKQAKPSKLKLKINLHIHM